MRRSDRECEAKCGQRLRVYVAISNNLHHDEHSRGRSWKDRYIFKVGVTKACYKRQASINGRRKSGEPWPDGDVYAGVDDWQIVQCWNVETPDHDKKFFRPWAKEHGLAILPVVCDRSGRARKELYRLTSLQVALRYWPSTGHVLHDEIVSAAIAEIGRRVVDGIVPDFGGCRLSEERSWSQAALIVDQPVAADEVTNAASETIEIEDWALPTDPDDDIDRAIDLMTEMIVLALRSRIGPVTGERGCEPNECRPPLASEVQEAAGYSPAPKVALT